MATVTAFTAFSNCQILFSQYFTNLLKNWQLALRKLPICVLAKIHKNVHGRACFFPGLCGSKNIIKNTMQRRKQHKRMERIPQKEQNQAPAAAPTRKKRIMP